MIPRNCLKCVEDNFHSNKDLPWSYACRFWLIRVETFPFRCIFHYHSHLLFTSMKCSWDNCTTINFLRYKRVTAATLDAIFLIIYFSGRLKIDDDARSCFCTQEKCGSEHYKPSSYYFVCILMWFQRILIRLHTDIYEFVCISM